MPGLCAALAHAIEGTYNEFAGAAFVEVFGSDVCAIRAKNVFEVSYKHGGCLCDTGTKTRFMKCG
jgi:hypothetical protein